MSCSACQEQEIEVDLGCQHFYCRACLEHLGGKCRDGCVPIPQMSIEDARKMLLDAENHLESLELLAPVKIADLEKLLNRTIKSTKEELELQCGKIKKAEAILDTLLSRSQLQLNKFAVVPEYVKVHFESDCEKVSDSVEFGIIGFKKPYKPPHLTIVKGYDDSPLVRNVKPVKGYNGYPFTASRSNLKLIAKSQKMLALRSDTMRITFIVNLEDQTETQEDIVPDMERLYFFRDKELVSCSIPDGFKHVSGNIGVRQHEDLDKIEIFDPAVGKLELVITDRSRGRLVEASTRDLSLGYPSRTVIRLRNACRFAIPYLD